ncbi:major tail protein [Eubacterium sp.]|uniref:major tail protein n=1 Tax=Eubacterium sp. TaxID=142586 RepID=UPI0026DFBC78|nr:major tail protein [Eubacterium sp.]MDO5431779.1 phage tail protein [Eubacterium sp.]
MPKKNKVKFNICNVHYALQSIAEDGTVSFETPVAMPGAVSLALDANGEPSNFYADGYAYYTISNNMGYDGDLELAMVPESFRTDVLKEELDSNQVLVENANVETANFALLFEFDGDVKKIRHVLYNCAASRPSIESQTNEDEIEVKTETLALKATPMANGYVKAKTGDSTTDAVYQKWYEAVYLPTAAEAVLKVQQNAASTVKAVSKDTAADAKTTAAAKEV